MLIEGSERYIGKKRKKTKGEKYRARGMQIEKAYSNSMPILYMIFSSITSTTLKPNRRYGEDYVKFIFFVFFCFLFFINVNLSSRLR